MRGEDGKDGADGEEGACGPKGFAGPCGPLGDEGPCGPEGKEGQCGPLGVEGMCGVEGQCGIDGACGLEGSCFVEGTEIRMSDGSLKNIEDIKNGDKVLTLGYAKYDESKSGYKTYVGIVHGKTAHIHNEDMVKIICEDGSEITCTDDHYIFSENGEYKQAKEFKQGEKLITYQHNLVKITDISLFHESNIKTFNFEVEEYVSYIANNIWVHNGSNKKMMYMDETYNDDTIVVRNWQSSSGPDGWESTINHSPQYLWCKDRNFTDINQITFS